MSNLTHAQIISRLKQAEMVLETYNLKLLYINSEQLSITNKDQSIKMEYSTHFTFYNCNTVEEVEAFIYGLEVGTKFSKPAKEKK